MINKHKHRIFKRYIVCILAIFICTVLLGIGIVRDNKLQKKQKTIAVAYNKAQSEKQQEEVIRIKVLKEYDGFVISTLGDSITAQAKWQPSVVSELGFSNYNNYGVGGSRVSGNSNNAMWQDSRIDEISKESNIILFMGGMNDWAQNISLGTLNSVDTNTFYGALNTVYDKLGSKFPNTKIIFMSTTFGMLPNRDAFKDKTGLKNDIGLMSIDYGKAIEKVALTKKIAFIDLTNCGWNKDNIATYVTNDGGYLHPNADGGKNMANIIITRLKEIKSTK